MAARVEYLEDDPDHERFMSNWNARLNADPKFAGAIHGPKRFPHNWAWDAGTFCHKVFAMTSEAAIRGTSWLIYLDADVETTTPVTMDWLKQILADETDIVHLGRRDMRSSDTAFLAFRVNQHGYMPARSFLKALRFLYTSGDIFEWAEWTDGHLVERLCTIWEGQGAKVKNLSVGIPGLDVFEKTVLGERLSHHKGPRGKAELMAR